MGRYIVNGSRPLSGEIVVQGAKNAVLPLFAAALLTEDPVVIEHCPDLSDVNNMGRILESLGADVTIGEGRAKIACRYPVSHEIPARLASELRSSIFLLGSVLGRMKEAKVAYPGGCDIGLRPIDLHLKALRELGVKITERHGYIYCDARKMHAAPVTLDYPSVGATENVMLLASVAEGETVLENAAREPEIVDLQNFINAMGGSISGAGSPTVRIRGGERLKGTEYQTMPDRIVAGTYLIACAMCTGELRLKRVNPAHLSSLIAKLSKSGCKIEGKGDTLTIKATDRPKGFDLIDTQPYPGFPTDLQAQMTALASIAEGTTVIGENIFETRFKHVPELIKMGASIKVKDRIAVVKGVNHLTGAEVTAMDLRGGAALILAGLAAHGTTIVNEIRHVERGYEGIERVLRSAGADIIRI